MSISIGAAASRAVYALPGTSPGQAQSANTIQAAQQAARSQAAVTAAQQELAKANSVVDQDKRNHSPGCVACDQKLVDKAQVQLTQAKGSTSEKTTQMPLPLGSTIDFTA